MSPIQPLVEATGPSPDRGPESPFPLQAGTTEAAAAIRPPRPLKYSGSPPDHPIRACHRHAPAGTRDPPGTPHTGTARGASFRSPAVPGGTAPPLAIPAAAGTQDPAASPVHPRPPRGRIPAAPVSRGPVLRSVTADLPCGPARAAIPATANPASGTHPRRHRTHPPNTNTEGDSLPTDGPAGQSRVPSTPTGIPRQPSLQGRIPPFRPPRRPKLIRSQFGLLPAKQCRFDRLGPQTPIHPPRRRCGPRGTSRSLQPRRGADVGRAPEVRAGRSAPAPALVTALHRNAPRTGPERYPRLGLPGRGRSGRYDSRTPEPGALGHHPRGGREPFCRIRPHASGPVRPGPAGTAARLPRGRGATNTVCRLRVRVPGMPGPSVPQGSVGAVRSWLAVAGLHAPTTRVRVARSAPTAFVPRAGSGPPGGPSTP